MNVADGYNDCSVGLHSMLRSATFNVAQDYINRNINRIKEQRDIKPCSTEITDADENAEKNPDVKFEKEFDSICDIYPRKEGKTTALKNYCIQRKNGASYEDIRKGLQGYIRQLKANCTENRYIKMASTFFENSCWKDYLNTSGAAYGGFSEPTSGDEFAREHELIDHEFGGDANVYAKWLLCGKPEPVGEWLALYRSKRGRRD